MQGGGRAERRLDGEGDIVSVTILNGDVRDVLLTLPAESVQCVVCSPPYYGLRDYNVAGQIGLEPSPDAYVSELVAVFREVRRVLRPDGVLFLNLGDSYASHDPGGYRPGEFLNPDGRPPVKQGNARNRAGNYRSGDLKPKDLMMMPARVALALQADGWWLRSDIIWAKPNPMPESVTDRPTSAHEHVFLLTKSARYFWDADAVAEPSEYPGDNRAFRTDTRKLYDAMCADNGSRARTGQPTGATRNLRSVWTIATQPFSAGPGSHGAGDGIGRITSPDCPVHGDRRPLVSTARRDEQQDASRSDRSPYSDRPEQLPLDAPSPIATLRDVASEPDNSGSPVPSCERTAMRHNTQTRKTAPSPETSPHETVAAVSLNRTDDNEQCAATGATFDHSLLSNTSRDASVDGLRSDPSARKSRSKKDKCSCGYIDHFATFPPALVERCIKAGSKPGDTILDPFAGAFTAPMVADRLQRNAIGIELNADYCDMARRRLVDDGGMFMELAT